MQKAYSLSPCCRLMETEKKFMKIKITAVLLLLCILAGFASATGDTAAAQVSVTSVTVSPTALMHGDTGTVTVEITNNGDEVVAISRAKLYSDDLTVQNDLTYDSVGNLGAGNSLTFTFTVRADAPDGFYYMTFYLDYRDAGSLRYSVPVTVESTEASVSVLDAPDSFAGGNKETITVTVGNPRDNTLKGVIATIGGPGISTTMNSAFIGDITPGSSQVVSFEVTTLQESDITVTVAYRNGINDHTSAIAIPVEFGEDKLGAELVLNSIEYSGGTGSWTLSADVTNAGLSDAKSIVVTVASPAEPVDPNGVYVIGALEPDDFSSFDITFTTPGTTVPVLVTYKDEDGNVFSEVFDVSLGGTTTAGGDAESSRLPVMSGAGGPAGGPAGGRNGLFGGFGTGLSQVPIVQIALVLLVGIGAVIGWRKGWFRRITEKVNEIRSGKRR
ncbi:MAG: hypothetical protein APR53_10650 [Methanoculleus sp. SDB]|nr:MAG: hypothetical protein APR53_10650 [Methanoculleus sp. SDB]